MPVKISSTATVLLFSSLTRSTSLLPLYAYPDGSGIEVDLDSISRKRVGNKLRGVALLLGQEQWHIVRDDGVSIRPGKRLAPIRSPAGHRR